MGVHGLWRLIEPSGKPVPLETLENKVLAVDVSIWLHQAIKGFQDAKGGSLPNAHLLGIYHRVCKLLYFKIKPIFVFDGGVPVLKKQTIERRNQFKQRNQNDANKIQEQLLNTILKHSAISKVLSDKAKAALESQTTKKISPIKNNKDERDNMFILPATEFDSTMSSDDDSEYLTEETTETDSSPTKQFDLHTIETKSSYFKSLPADVRHEILTDLKETRKQSSWGRLHELPSQSNDFSVFQMRRLLKRQEVQSALEEAEKEMGGHSLSLGELETILNDQGVITIENMGKRIASDENTRYLLIKDIKQAMEKAKNEQALQAIKEKEEVSKEGGNGEISTSFEKKSEEKKIADEEFDEDLKLAIALSLQEGPSTSKVSMGPSKSTAVEEVKKNLQLSFIDENFDSDSSEDFEDVIEPKKPLTSAQSYMMEYSGLTPSEIAKIIDKNAVKGGKKIKKLIGDIKQNVNKEKNIAEETQSVAEIKQKSAEETLSDDEDSDFLEVSDAEELPIIVDNNKTSSKIEIVVDPNKSLEDDLFGDIFVNESNKKKIHLNEENDDKDKDKKNAIEIIVNPIVTPEDDLFSDIFVDELNKREVQFEKKIINITEENMKTIVDINPTKIENSESLLEKDDLKLKSNEEEIIKVPEENNIRTEVKNKGINLEVQNIKELTTPEIRDTLKQTVNIDNNSKENKKSEVESISGLSETELKEMKDKLKNQQIDLLIEKSSKERMAKNISDQMYQEAQELLELFGVPYIIAPMEAEAQCAFLDDVNLTDGTITDDSDIWLFGGKTVYKNFFNQAKQVMEFKAENIKHHFKLSREQMILLALLVGSDYTTGLQGVGPVTAMEILAAFPPTEKNQINLTQSQLVSGLKEFHMWFEKGSGKPRLSLKKKLKNVHFSENFPSLQVVQAYMEPTVETSKEKFSWGKPDIVALTDFAKEKFGWTKLKTEEILKPVIKKIAESTSQKTIKEYFRTKFIIQPGLPNEKISKRVRVALEKFGKDPDEVSDEDDDKPKRSKKIKKDETEDFKSKKVRVRRNSKEIKNKTGEDNKNEPKEPKPTGSRRKSEEKVSETKPAQSRKTKNQDKPKSTSSKRVKISADPFLSKIPEELKQDEEIKELQQITKVSAEKVEEISNDLTMELNKKLLLQKVKEKELKKEIVAKQIRNIHIRKDVVYQKEMDKSHMLRSKMKAIEVYRRGKMGPGYVKKNEKKTRLPKDDAGLSESSSDE